MNMIWLLWFGAAIFFFIIEVLTPTFFVVCFAIGCLAAAICSLAFPGDSFVWLQLTSFAIATFVSFLAIQPLSKKLRRKESRFTTNMDALIGEFGIVTAIIGPGHKRGRILIQGVSWRAVAHNGQRIEIDERVKVVRFEGTTLTVELAYSARENRL